MTLKRILAVAVGLGALVPCAAFAQERNPTIVVPPPTETSKEKPVVTAGEPNRVLLSSGALLFGVPYISSVLVAATTDSSANNNLYIPLVGPWVTLGERDCSAGQCPSEFISGTLLVADGIFQAAGLFAMGASLFVPEEKTTFKISANGGKMTVAPGKMGTQGYGISAVGQF